jgi:PHD/YefM family antitoxin component YafN of YafNO toxin-antitoxin module
LGDEEARRRHTQKSILERKAPPTFDVVVEQQSWEELVVHRDVADTVDNMLRGQPIVAEERTRDLETGRVSSRRITIGGMEVPAWDTGGPGSAGRYEGFSARTFERGDRNGNGNNSIGQLRQVGQQAHRGGGDGLNGRSSLKIQAASQPLQQVVALAPTGTAPGDIGSRPPATLITTSHPLDEGIYQAADAETQLPLMKTMRVYPFGVNRDRLAESARHLRVPVIITNNQNDADAVITVKNYYRRQSDKLQQAEQDRKLIIILKNNTVAQMQHALARIFDIPMIEDTVPDDEDEEPDDNGTGQSRDDETMRALLEAEDAIHQVLNKGLTTAELAPASAYVRRLQHQMATRYNLMSRSRGKEPNRRVKIFRARE